MSKRPMGLDLRGFMAFVLFAGHRAPEQLWVGLATKEIPQDIRLRDIGPYELQDAPTYGRIPVPPKDWSVLPNPPGAAAVVFFKNGSDKPWPTAAYSFVATADGDDGFLVCSDKLDVPRLLMAGDMMRLEVNVNL